MTSNTPWTPSLAWHAKVLSVLLLLCAAVLGIGWYITARLPQPYQVKHPAPQATPWKGQPQENL